MPLTRNGTQAPVNQNQGNDFVSGSSGSEQPQTPIREEHVGYVLYELEADTLHTPPFSAEIPIIKTEVDGTVFMAHVINNKIVVQKGQGSGEDLYIITTRQAIVDAVKSEDVVKSIKNSIDSGESKLEIVSDRRELLMKGYLDIYNELTKGQAEIYYSPYEKVFNVSLMTLALVAIIFVVLILIIYLKFIRRS